ncbi:MAG: CHASE2 domain-containing protein [Deltaproteobacteria bacterium]|nr:CHASE2 domain-containing protein [Deltaproteobacteria bacterium]
MALKKKALARIPNWTIGVILTLVISILFLLNVNTSGGFLGAIELKSYDLRMKLFSETYDKERIAIVAIDSESIAKLGRWPWSRDKVAKMIVTLKDAGAAVTGMTILFSEPEESTGLDVIGELRSKFTSSSISKTKEGKSFLKKMARVEKGLDNDLKLEHAMGYGSNVVLPYAFNLGSGIIKKPKDLPSFALDTSIGAIEPAREELYFYPYRAESALYPIEKLSLKAKSLGHMNRFTWTNPDGIDRWEALLIKYGDEYYPSFALSVARSYLGLDAEEVSVDLRPDEGVLRFGTTEIRPDANLGVLINYFSAESSFPVYSFFDVYNDKVQKSAFKDKIVLIGVTDIGFGDLSPTPMKPLYSSVARQATVIENILSGSVIIKPVWYWLAGLASMIFVGFITTVVISRFSSVVGTVVSGVLFLGCIGGSVYAFTAMNMWVELTHPAVLVLLNYLALTSKKVWFTERAQREAESESDEANKLLGLTFQGKGMLEMAYEKYKNISVTEELKEVLYNLGLDFEKKRNFAQAKSVYERIGDVKYKDIKERIERLSVEGGGGAVSIKGGRSTIIRESGETPTLGRYEVIRELGRGAMGVVYLGKDPKINRQVAIKTVNFDEVDEKMITPLKERFFREAESAGTLNHPNILTIFDVGEDGNLAYIAMELIDGKDLEDWTTQDRLLKPKDALLVVAKVADALEFAHTHGIIHRDIKPANIMVTKKSEIKVTDFGIAKIQDTSHTKTGTIMGTPSYMSPEQVAGDHVDGRTDIFSLGVVLFELMSGAKPFHGESIANIMYNITNKPHPLLKEKREGLPEFAQALIDKALSKNPDERFQKAGEFAGAIRWCINKYGDQLK